MLAIAPTDINWFNLLSSQKAPNIVNFWTPTPWNVRKLKDGDHLLFLLKAPYRKIAGYGTYKYYENMTAKEAWNKFGLGNGVKSLDELVKRATGYAKIHSTNPNSYESSNPEIGCIVLEKPIFFDEEDFFKPEHVGLTFAPQVVKLKYFEMDLDELHFNNKLLNENHPFKLVDPNQILHKNKIMKERKGQSIFKREILKAYNNRCAISLENCTEVLEAAHIQEYINEDSNHIQNGLLLRSDIHTLFDAGLITIDMEYVVRVSPYLKSDYYQSLGGKRIYLPRDPFHRPSLHALEIHNIEVFRK